MNELQLYWPQLVGLAGFVWWAMKQARDYERLLGRVEWLETTSTELVKIKSDQTRLSGDHDRLKDSVDRMATVVERLESKLDALALDVHGIKLTLATTKPA